MGEDPLRKAYGTPYIYRVDPSRVRITPVSASDCDENPTDAEARVSKLVAALTSLPQCPGMQLGPACFQKFSVRKDGIAVTTSLAREPPAGSERTDVRAVAWLDQATASRSFKSTFDRFKARKTHEQWKFESFAVAGQPDTGALEVWLDSRFGGERKEAGRANGVFICGKVESNLTMFISARNSAYKGKALVDATQAQMNALLQQIGNAVKASGACP